MSTIFPSTYPILAAPMNQVSELNLAVACYNSGIFPSISALCFVNNGKVDWKEFLRQLNCYNDQTDSNNLLVSVPDKMFYNDMFQSLLDQKLFTHLEIICTDLRLNNNTTLSKHDLDNLDMLKKSFARWKIDGYTFVYKSLARFVIYDIYKNYRNELFDAFVLKGPDAAGMVIDRKNGNGLLEDCKEIISKFPDIKIIASGGIGAKQDIDNLLEIGVDSISIGTVLAASKESVLSTNTKNKMIAADAKGLHRFSNSNQNALTFTNIQDDDFNHTSSLKKGISTGEEGHIFAGKGIQHIKHIRPVADIIKDLTNETKF
jgi:NAD(P)H-dependent flavin oxidoreductase YrpB (nitropropane dioxygenase family)